MNPVDSAQKISLSISINDAKTQIEDLDQQCMKKLITSFEISSPVQASALRAGGEQIIFRLRPLDSVRINYVNKDGTLIDGPKDTITFAVACAAESVLKIMHKDGYVGKDAVTFQLRRKMLDISPIYSILLSEEAKGAFDFEKGIVNRSYAYLSQRELCVFLNQTKPDILKKIDELLAKHFPRTQKPFTVEESKEEFLTTQPAKKTEP